MKFKVYHTFTKLPARYGRLASLPYLDMLPQHFFFSFPNVLINPLTVQVLNHPHLLV